MVPENWRFATYAEVTEINRETVSTDTDPEMLIEYLDIGSILGPGRASETQKIALKDAPSRARRRARAGDTIMSTVRPQLKSIIHLFDPPANLVVSTAFAVLRPTRELDPSFLFQTTLRDEFTAELVKRQAGSNYPAVRPTDIAEILLPVPPLPEQRKIAAILSSVDQTIAKTEAVVERLRAAKVTLGQQLLAKGSPRRHPQFKNSEIGPVPADWQVLRLGSVCELQTGYPFKSKDFSSTGIRLLRGSNVGVGQIDWTPSRTEYYPELLATNFQEYALNPGDIVLAMDRPFITQGFKVARIGETDAPALLLQRVGRIRNTRNIDPNFLWCVICSDFVSSHLRLSQKGTDLPHISRAEFENCLIPVPTPEEQKEIAAVITSFDARIDTELRSLSGLQRVKSALAAALLTGQIRVTPDEATT